MRRTVPALLTLLIVLLTTTTARAVEVPWLYEVHTPVPTQSAADRNDAAATALLELLVRLSGRQNLDTAQPELAQALAQPDRFVRQYRYLRQQDTDELQLVFEFDRPAALDLVKRAELPLWWSNRPAIRAWIRVQEGARFRWLVTGDQHPLALALAQAARRRGLPVVLPETTLATAVGEDGGFDGRLANAVLRAEQGAEVDVTLMAEVTNNGPAQRAAVQVWRDGQVQRQQYRAALPEALMGATVDALADTLAAEFALASNAGRGVRLQVLGVVTPAQYAALLRYLGSLAFVDDTAVLSLADGVLELGLATGAPPERLLDLLDQDGRLIRDRAEAVFGAPAAGGYAVRWLGDGAR